MPDTPDPLLVPLDRPVSHLGDLINFAKQNNLRVGSTTGGTHNVGSKHYTGNAIDIKGSGAFDDATVSRLSEAAKSQGLLLRDERVRPPRQKVWGGPHVHIEYSGQQPAVKSQLQDPLLVPLRSDSEIPPVQPSAPPRIGSRGQVTASKPAQTPKTSVTLGEGAIDESALLPTAKPVEFTPGNATPRKAGPTELMMQPFDQPQAGGTVEDQLTEQRYKTPPSTELAQAVKIPFSPHLNPTEDDMVKGYLNALGPEYAKFGDKYKQETGRNILSLQTGDVDRDPDGSAYVKPTRAAIDVLNAYVKSGGDINAAKAEGARIAQERRGAVTTAEQRAAPDIAEVQAARIGLGTYSGTQRAIESPIIRYGAGKISQIGGLVSGFGVAPNKLSDYLNTRAKIMELGSSLPPLTPQGKQIQRSVPEKVGTALGDLGLGVFDIIAMKRATGLSMGQIMALEAALKDSDAAVPQRAAKVAQAYAMGKILDSHLDRIMTAGVFAAPSAVEGAQQVARGEKSKTDALLDVAIQGGFGAILSGGKSEGLTELGLREGANAKVETQPNITAQPEGAESASIVAGTRVPRTVEGRGAPGAELSVPESTAGVSLDNRQQPNTEIVRGTDGAQLSERSSMASESKPAGSVVDESAGRGAEVARPTHASLQARRVRGEGKGQFRNESKSEREARLAQVRSPQSASEVQSQPAENLQSQAATTSPEVSATTASIPFNERPRNDVGLNDVQQSEWDKVLNNARDYGGKEGVETIIDRSRLSPAQKEILKQRISAQPVTAETTATRPPVEGEAASTTTAIASLLDRYDNQGHEGRPWVSDNDAVSDLEQIAADSNDPRARNLLDQIEQYREDQRSYRQEYGMRMEEGDAEGIIEAARKLVASSSLEPTAAPKDLVSEATDIPRSPESQDASARSARELSATSARKAQMSTDRESLDLPELPPAQRKSWRTSLENAKPEKAGLLADEVLTKPRALNDEETASLVVRAQEIKNEHSRVMKEIGDATNPEFIAQKRAEAGALENEFDKLTRATKASGTEKGRALASQKLTINQDYDLVSMVQRAKAAKGRDLTPQERVRYEEQANRIADLEKQLSEAQEKAKTKSLQREINKVRRTSRRQETKAVLDDEFAALKAQFAIAKAETKGVQASGLAGLDPEGKLTPLVAKMARNRVKAGVTDAAQLVDEVYSALREHVEGLKREDIRDTVLGFGLAEGKERARQTQLLKQGEEFSRRLKEGDFSPNPKREPPVYNRETYRLQKQIDQIKADYHRELYKATRGRFGVVTDEMAKAANIAKTIKSMGDISAVFRQGGFYAITHPIAGLAKPSVAMLRSFSERGNRNINEIIKADPAYEILKRGGTEFTGVDKADPKLSHREEGYFGADTLETIGKGKVNPLRLVSGTSKFSERTFTSFLDAQRLHVGKVMLDGLTDPGIIARTLGARPIRKGSPEYAKEVKALSDLINTGTGRGSLGKYNNAAPFLNILMFSPRLIASRVQLLNNMFNPVKMARMPRAARAQMIQDNVKFLAGTAAVMALASAAGGKVNTDPDDGDFLKIRFGSTTYDTLVGLQQPLRYLINMKRAALGRDEILAVKPGDTYTGKSMFEQTFGSKTHGGFLESKSSPLAGATIESIRGTDFLGRKRTIAQRATDLVTPLPVRDFYEAMQKEGLVKGALKASPTLMGIGVNTYDESPEKPATHAEKLARKFVRDSIPDDARTDEQIDQGKKLADLRARSRRGENIESELASSGATERQAKSIRASRAMTRLQEDVKKLPLGKALTVYADASPEQQSQLDEIIGAKAKDVIVLPSDEQAAMRARLDALGFEAGREMPKPAAEPERPKRPDPRDWKKKGRLAYPTP